MYLGIAQMNIENLQGKSCNYYRYLEKTSTITRERKSVYYYCAPSTHNI